MLVICIFAIARMIFWLFLIQCGPVDLDTLMPHLKYFLFFSVCIKFLTRFEKLLDEENIEGEPAIREKLKEVCKKAKSKENRFVSFQFRF